ncbi:hypothetical protein [Acidocella aminolytica]|uniref:Transposase n=1 Tax=Acidocella aminolytica 101 = DSM 11237 TaxID=1120923 RepID=A0A0D6PLJ9_9PROT|nr:hypothetical protein [Acidocella aminolytica]GAN82221.1 hypothetical protein Aam_182_006 [Acidocella aminolytica 101 = DSM 11237]GBQ36056.1 hypothetical protein AA11237_1134 [Acidocella aminolytica 101 = DSM 11237]SHF37137.1 hypothetical protein SAMN02746095_03000 [Acidocella aminolytica 101 = DSM 11237]
MDQFSHTQKGGHSRTRESKSRLNFLDLLRAGYADYVVNDAALAYMRGRALAGPVIRTLADATAKEFADHGAWQAHLDQLGISALKVHPDPVWIATEGALWGAVRAHGFLNDTVIVSDDAGQFVVGSHALCWVHAERLVHRLDTFTDRHRVAQAHIRNLIWWFYADLKAYRADPSPRRRSELRVRFDRIFRRRTGFATRDRLLARLHVTRRKISGGTQVTRGRDCRDAFLGLMRTATRLGFSFWDYLGDRLHIPDHAAVPYLPDLLRARAQQA